MRSAVIRLTGTVLVLALGFLLTFIGSILLGVGLILAAILVLVGVLALDLVHHRGVFAPRSGALDPTPTHDPARLRMDDHLIPDTATRNHAVYFRLRFWNDGGGAITPEVRVTRVLLGDALDEAKFAAQLPLLLPWSSLATAPRLTRQHTEGETVGVIAALNRAAIADGRSMVLDPPLLYIAGAQHNPEIGQVIAKVFVKVQAVVPDQPQFLAIEDWFWIQVAKAENRVDGAYYFNSGHLEEEPGQIPANDSTNDEGAVATDLDELMNERLGEIPLTRAERLALLHVLRAAISDVDHLPYSGEITQDIAVTGGVRDDRIWTLSLNTAKAYAGGIIRSDGTYATLRDLYGRIEELRKEVHRRYHPPAMPAR